jgi:hypothetical protein
MDAHSNSSHLPEADAAENTRAPSGAGFRRELPGRWSNIDENWRDCRQSGT